MASQGAAVRFNLRTTSESVKGTQRAAHYPSHTVYPGISCTQHYLPFAIIAEDYPFPPPNVTLPRAAEGGHAQPARSHQAAIDCCNQQRMLH